MSIFSSWCSPKRSFDRDQHLIGTARVLNERPAARMAARRALGRDAYRLDGLPATVFDAKVDAIDAAFTGHVLLLSDTVGPRQLHQAINAGVTMLEVGDRDGLTPGVILVAKVIGALSVERQEFYLGKLSVAARHNVVFDDMALRRARGDNLVRIRRAIDLAVTEGSAAVRGNGHQAQVIPLVPRMASPVIKGMSAT